MNEFLNVVFFTALLQILNSLITQQKMSMFSKKQLCLLYAAILNLVLMYRMDVLASLYAHSLHAYAYRC